MASNNARWGIILSVFLMIGSAASSATAHTLWEDNGKKFDLSGDLRFRQEMDNNNSKTGTNSPDRTRERIRLRVAGKYSASDRIEAGFRLASGSNNLNSPHQTLGDTTSTTATNGNPNFGIDRAYLKYKSKNGTWLTVGKNGLPIKQLSETWIDTDYSPEGIFLGYKKDDLALTVSRLIIRNNGNTAANDYGILAGGNYSFKAGAPVMLAFGSLSVDESSRDASETTFDVLGGDANYIYVGGEAKVNIFKIGAEYYSSNVATAERGGANAKSSDKTGLVAYAKVKLNSTFGVRYYFQDIGYASVPLLGGWAADDFPNTSNYTGSRFQLDIDTGLGMKIDARYYTQTTKNKDLTPATGSNGLAPKATGEAATINRVQINFNVAF